MTHLMATPPGWTDTFRAMIPSSEAGRCGIACRQISEVRRPSSVGTNAASTTSMAFTTATIVTTMPGSTKFHRRGIQASPLDLHRCSHFPSSRAQSTIALIIRDDHPRSSCPNHQQPRSSPRSPPRYKPGTVGTPFCRIPSSTSMPLTGEVRSTPRSIRCYHLLNAVESASQGWSRSKNSSSFGMSGPVFAVGH
jgi:hypothetical protein